MASKIKFWELNYHEIAHALKNIDPVHEFEILEDIMIAEANVFLCKFKGKKINIYFDLAYGAEIKEIDKIEKKDLKRIEELILSKVV